MSSSRLNYVGLAVAMAAMLLPSVKAGAGDPYAAAPAYAQPVVASASLKPVITTGQRIPLSSVHRGTIYQAPGVPDGMGIYRLHGDGSDGTTEFLLFVNHEFSGSNGVPFGTLPSGARVSQYLLQATGRVGHRALGVRSGKLAFDRVVDGETGRELTPTAGISRLCSAFLADEAVGFDRAIFLTGEESHGKAFDGKGPGVFAIYDGKAHTFPRMGRSQWENAVVAPFTGGKTVIFGMQDGGALSSHLYMYVGDKVADGTDGMAKNGLNDGSLYTFAGSSHALNSEAAFRTKGQSIQGHWAKVNWDQTARALTAEAAEKGAFGFTRLEDGAADPTHPGIFYFAATGKPKVVSNHFGRVYRLSFDPEDPVGPVTLTILLDGSEGIVSPDNIDINKHGEMIICEDPNYNLTKLGLHRDTSLWAYNVQSGTLTRIAEVDRKSAYAHAIGADARNAGSTVGAPGGWEFSGVVDAEAVLGRGSWLVTVQAHTLRIHPVDVTVEGGQILHLTWLPKPHGGD